MYYVYINTEKYNCSLKCHGSCSNKNNLLFPINSIWFLSRLTQDLPSRSSQHYNQVYRLLAADTWQTQFFPNQESAPTASTSISNSDPLMILLAYIMKQIATHFWMFLCFSNNKIIFISTEEVQYFSFFFKERENSTIQHTGNTKTKVSQACFYLTVMCMARRSEENGFLHPVTSVLNMKYYTCPLRKGGSYLWKV